MKHSDTLRKLLPTLLFCYIIASCAIPNILLSFTEPYTWAMRMANVLFPIGIYMLLMSTTTKVGKSGCWMFILMFFAAFQIVLLFLFGRSVIAVDMFLNLVTTNPDEVNELLGNMLPVVGLVAVLYLPPLAASIYCLRHKIRVITRLTAISRLAGIAATAIGLVLIIVSYITVGNYKVRDHVYPLNVFYNIYLAVERTVKTADYHTTSADFSYHAQSTRPADMKEVYVAVIGETSRAPQWHIFGYSRNTTSALDSIAGLVGYGHTLSESNTTHKSVPMLMSSLNANTFNDSIYTHRGLITAFKESGFSTMYISNQAHNHSFIDFFGNEADSTLFINTTTIGGTHKFDHDMLPIVREQIAKNPSPKQLYVLHCYGSHFSYPDRYPAGTGPFTPDTPVEVSGDNHERLVNAYDNTIDYTAHFLADLIGMLSDLNCQAAMIYTSDHGEDIFDDDRNMFLHASPVPSYYQIHVPMILWMSPQYVSREPDKLSAAIANSSKQVSSSNSYFHSLMEMAGIATPYFIPQASLVNNSYTFGEPVYLNDHNEGLMLRDIGLKHQDFDQLSNRGFRL